MTYFVKIQTKTYTSLQSTLSLSILEKDRSEKRWSLSKIGFFRRRNNLSPCIPYEFAPRRAQKSLCNHEDPITGNSLIAIDLQQTCGGEYNHYLIASETDKGPIRTCEKVVCLDKISVTTNRLQVRMVCRDLTNFGRSGQIFRRIADKICPR